MLHRPYPAAGPAARLSSLQSALPGTPLMSCDVQLSDVVQQSLVGSQPSVISAGLSVLRDVDGCFFCRVRLTRTFSNILKVVLGVRFAACSEFTFVIKMKKLVAATAFGRRAAVFVCFVVAILATPASKYDYIVNYLIV